ncbi:ribosome recycling factor [Acidicapsa dinghuensis]|uniref:Ribosome-recycling factor n=1 Tax=Acidicapsa dinghuensis TaxID=2218256 RepID=A0ABW1EAW0_9BACT|nr:ribosome recycling factor [Acidicapsa dinghuensis]
MAASLMAGHPVLKELHTDVKRRMDKAVEDFQTHLISLRTGRASVHLLDQVRVDYYGTPTPLNQVAQVSAPEPGMILVQPWDASLVKEIEKALRAPEHGFNPQNDGKMVRVPIPPMTEERRKAVVKQLNQELEDHRTALRNVRRDGNDHLKKLAKDKKISEDEEKRAQEEVQGMLNEEIKRMEEAARKKEADIMQV